MIQDDYRAVIDVGTTKVCAILARKRPDHRIELVGIGVSQSAGMRAGTVTDKQALATAIREAADQAGAQAGLEIVRAYVGLSGSHIESRNKWDNVSRDGGMRTVTDADLANALRIAGRVELPADRKLLHVIPRSYALDGIHGIRNPLGMHSSELHIESHIITGSVSHIHGLQEAVHAAGISPIQIIVEPVASAESVLTADEREEGTVLVDVGGGTSDVAVFYDGAIVHTASIPVGGFHFSNDLSIALSIDFDDAERLKLKHGTCAPELVGMAEEVRVHPEGMTEPLSITKREVGMILKERVQELFRMILLKLDEPHLEDVPMERIVFTGGGAKLDGFLPLGKFVFQRQVRLGAPRGLDGLPEENRDPSYSAAAGMSLWTMRNLPAENHVARPSRPRVQHEPDERETVTIFPGAGTVRSSTGDGNGNGGGMLSSLRGLFGGRK